MCRQPYQAPPWWARSSWCPVGISCRASWASWSLPVPWLSSPRRSDWLRQVKQWMKINSTSMQRNWFVLQLQDTWVDPCWVKRSHKEKCLNEWINKIWPRFGSDLIQLALSWHVACCGSDLANESGPPTWITLMCLVQFCYLEHNISYYVLLFVLSHFHAFHSSVVAESWDLTGNVRRKNKVSQLNS